ncbi:MAG: hypothetical protein ABJB66_02805, partial [Gemmatimonadaceae bacterium]
MPDIPDMLCMDLDVSDIEAIPESALPLQATARGRSKAAVNRNIWGLFTRFLVLTGGWRDGTIREWRNG